MLGFGGAPMACSPALQTGNEIVLKIAHMQISGHLSSMRSMISLISQNRGTVTPRRITLRLFGMVVTSSVPSMPFNAPIEGPRGPRAGPLNYLQVVPLTANEVGTAFVELFQDPLNPTPL